MYTNFQQCQNKLDAILAIDYFLAKQLCLVLKKVDDELLFHSIMATSQALRDGHSCLKLSAKAEQLCWANLDQDKTGYLFPSTEIWKTHLSLCLLNPEDNSPIIYQQQRLYLRRYWLFERQLSEKIKQFINKPISLDSIKSKQVISRLFPDSGNTKELDWQKIAVANTLNKQFSIIAGGPGTGKTFTVTKVLTALQMLSDNTLTIAMVAPTGKAAMRLNESINKAKKALQNQELIADKTIAVIPDKATTIHRLLGVKKGSHNFRFNEKNILPYDVILVDEISMIDLPLMCRLFRAIADSCQVIMLGDVDQLPSVAAGSILSDLAPQQTNYFSPANSEYLHQLLGSAVKPVKEGYLDYLTVLQKSFRFDGEGEIGKLAKDVIHGHVEKSWAILEQAQQQIEYINRQSFLTWLDSLIDKYYLPLLAIDKTQSALSIEQAFKQLDAFRFLVATRKGEQGLAFINDYVKNYLAKKLSHKLQVLEDNMSFYHGCPIMVTENNYQLGLYNGDIGLVWSKQNKLSAVFLSDSIRWFSLARLPAIEIVYAMTIHKTQGSEFSHVALILPDKESPILSRELLYTGITRASEKLSIWAAKDIWNIMVKRKIQRYSGLKQQIARNES